MITPMRPVLLSRSLSRPYRSRKGVLSVCAERVIVEAGCRMILMYESITTSNLGEAYMLVFCAWCLTYISNSATPELAQIASTGVSCYPPLCSTYSDMAYCPPHRRQLPSQASLPNEPSRSNAASTSNHYFTTRPPSGNGGSRPSRKDWSNGPSLQSPSSDLRPNRRLQDVKLDEMDMVQSISRSGGDGAEGDA
jgi:hypothetical protein